MILVTCRATIGAVGNEQHELIKVGKAGRARWAGKRPQSRGSVMNPNDHPHGGGEGKAPVGRPSPMSPWVRRLQVLRLVLRKQDPISLSYVAVTRNNLKAA